MDEGPPDSRAIQPSISSASNGLKLSLPADTALLPSSSREETPASVSLAQIETRNKTISAVIDSGPPGLQGSNGPYWTALIPWL